MQVEILPGALFASGVSSTLSPAEVQVQILRGELETKTCF